MKLNLKGTPSHLEPGLSAVAPELHLEFSSEGIPVTVESGRFLLAELSAGEGRIVYSKEAELFRALAHLAREGVGCRIQEHACFDENGLMEKVKMWD